MKTLINDNRAMLQSNFFYIFRTSGLPAIQSVSRDTQLDTPRFLSHLSPLCYHKIIYTKNCNTKKPKDSRWFLTAHKKFIQKEEEKNQQQIKKIQLKKSFCFKFILTKKIEIHMYSLYL